jgi:hypothetical protein
MTERYPWRWPHVDPENFDGGCAGSPTPPIAAERMCGGGTCEFQEPMD